MAFVTMEFEESRYDRRNAKEKEYLIDDLKDEVSYLKEKNKQYMFREEGFENEMEAVVLAGMMEQPRGLSVGPEATLQLRMGGLLGQVQPGQSG